MKVKNEVMSFFRRVGRHPVVRGVCHALAVLAVSCVPPVILFGLALIAGCIESGDYYGRPADVAAANAKPGLFGGVTVAAPAVVDGAVRSANWLNGLGAVLLAGGCFALSQNGIRNSFGFGLALAGVSLLIAGFILPVYAGWVGLALFGGLVVWFWGRFRVAGEVGKGVPPV